MELSKGVLFGLISGIVFALLVVTFIYFFVKLNFKMLSLYTIGFVILFGIVFSLLGWLTEFFLRKYL